MTSPALLSANDLCVETPGGRPLFRDLSLSIGSERVAIIGRNGAGKSTLLEVLAGLEAAGSGVVRCRGERALVRQQLGDEFPGSPGEQRRAALEDARSQRPDLLLLDEPTQDLDADGIAWLSGWLRDWDRGLIVVSHDRHLLRHFEHFFVVAESGCRYFGGTFNELCADLERESGEAQRAYVRELQVMLDRERDDVVLGNRRERKKNLGRVRQLGRTNSKMFINGKATRSQAYQGKRDTRQRASMDAARQWAKATRRALSVELPLEVVLPSLPEEVGPPIVRLESVSAQAEANTLFEGIDLELTSRDRLAIVGPNGAGKTTLLKIIGRERDPTSGRARTDLARVGFIEQNAANWISDESLLHRLSFGSDPASVDEVAQLLVAHRFPLALAERPLASLSPGERVRAALLCLFQRRPVVELLVLDEPTDHLDFVGVVALQNALRAWKGGLCVVSHDDEFLDAIGIARRIAL